MRVHVVAGDTDYIVDALALHDHMAFLRPIMSSPTIVKVLHGCSNDVIWLQRDFHIYLVNVFDTEKACQVGKVLTTLWDLCVGNFDCLTGDWTLFDLVLTDSHMTLAGTAFMFDPSLVN